MLKTTDFMSPLFGIDVATKPRRDSRCLDWHKIEEIIKNNPNSDIKAGLREDWNNTSGYVYKNGKHVDDYVYGASTWATPIVLIDDEVEIECWKNGNEDNIPYWFYKLAKEGYK